MSISALKPYILYELCYFSCSRFCLPFVLFRSFTSLLRVLPHIINKRSPTTMLSFVFNTHIHWKSVQMKEGVFFFSGTAFKCAGVVLKKISDRRETWPFSLNPPFDRKQTFTPSVIRNAIIVLCRKKNLWLNTYRVVIHSISPTQRSGM